MIKKIVERRTNSLPTPRFCERLESKVLHLACPYMEANITKKAEAVALKVSEAFERVQIETNLLT